jgi:hypothetical protein
MSGLIAATSKSRSGKKPKPNGSRYFAGLVVLCVLIGFGRPRLADAICRRDRTGLRFGFDFGAGHRWGYDQLGRRSAERSASRLKGEAAKRRLRELVSSGSPAFHTNACNFGRRCGTLRINGVYVGATLVSEGLAVRFVCGATSCPKLPRPWC